MRFLILASLFLGFSNAYAADSVTLLKWVVAGNGCSKKSVEVISFANTFSVLFDELGPDLIANDKRDGKVQVRTCAIVFLLEVPQGKCIAGIDQALGGGVIKSANSRASLYYASALNGLPVMNRTLNFKRYDPINPEDFDSLFNVSGSAQFKTCQKARYQTYVANAIFTGERFSWADYLTGNLDSMDGSFTVRLK